ncbi:uncharacterized protein LOC109710040 [Ananas comosus]|uniref:Uncharacterized protein LOC109710040 n=1 Tax=Ananas comosus TaxID=4615 RepID=A0A6P5EX24_ANACO|nr:uncharacterized protein LOC109710040 [Ananas comosus]
MQIIFFYFSYFSIMDKSWMTKPRNSDAYKNGVLQFLEFAFCNASYSGKIMCPCVRCVNCSLQTYEDAKIHLICDGFLRGYTRWICHGEDALSFNSPINTATSSSASQSLHMQEALQVQECIPITQNFRRSDDIHGLLHDAIGLAGEPTNETNIPTNEFDERDGPEQSTEEPRMEQSNEETNGNHDFHKLLKDANEELYPGCKTFSKLSFILHLFHLKCLNGWSGESFTMLLEILADAFPEGTSLPRSSYEAKKMEQKGYIYFQVLVVLLERLKILYWIKNHGFKHIVMSFVIMMTLSLFASKSELSYLFY